MREYLEYWAATMFRGLLAMLAGTAVLVIPEMASTFLLLPFAVVVSVLCLAAYGTIDSAIVLVTSFMIPHQQPGRIALRLQGLGGTMIGILLFVLVYARFELHLFLYLAAIQALTTSVAEFIVARGTSAHHGSKWCYVSSAIAAISAICLVLGGSLGPRELAWLIYGYLGVFGFNLFVLAARMLFAERNLLHTSHLGTRLTASTT
jgi:uncharacterized membrane protein HdeD (DUF308 family)